MITCQAHLAFAWTPLIKEILPPASILTWHFENRPGFRTDDLLLLVQSEGDPLQKSPGPHCLLLLSQLEDNPGLRGQTTLHASASFSANAPGKPLKPPIELLYENWWNLQACLWIL